jgi:EamA-like transporter family
VKLDRGILAALGAAVLFGLSTPMAKTLVGEVSPLLLAGLLYAGSGTGLGILLAARAIGLGRTSIVRPRGADLAWLLAAVGFGGALGPYLLMYGLRMTDSAWRDIDLLYLRHPNVGAGTRLRGLQVILSEQKRECHLPQHLNECVAAGPWQSRDHLKIHQLKILGRSDRWGCRAKPLVTARRYLL